MSIYMDDINNFHKTTAPHSSHCVCTDCNRRDIAMRNRMTEVAEDAKAKAIDDQTMTESVLASLAQRLAERALTLKLQSEQCLELSRMTRFSRTMPLHAQRVLVNLLEATLAHV